MSLHRIRLQPLKTLSQDKIMQNVEYHICEADTRPYLVVKRVFTLPAKPPVKLPLKPSQIPARPLPPRRRPRCRHALSIAACQCIYALAVIALGYLAYYYLEAWPVYRIVALAIIAILWSNFAGITALKKPIDMLATVSMQAIHVGQRKRTSNIDNIAFVDNTNVFLQSIKSSFLEKSNEIR